MKLLKKYFLVTKMQFSLAYYTVLQYLADCIFFAWMGCLVIKFCTAASYTPVPYQSLNDADAEKKVKDFP